MAWIVGIVGEKSDLIALSESLTGSDLTIREEDGGHVLVSDRFADEDQPKAVMDKAQKIVEILSGAVCLALGARKRFRLGNVYRRRPEGGREIFANLEPAVFHVRGSVGFVLVRADGTVEVSRPADPVKNWMPVALADEAVANVLRIRAGGELDWVNLYRIFEIVAADVGGLDAVAEKGWGSKASMRLFKHTANSPGALGLESRHGAESTDPPSKPMTIAEARALVDAIVHAWLRDKTESM